MACAIKPQAIAWILASHYELHGIGIYLSCLKADFHYLHFTTLTTEIYFLTHCSQVRPYGIIDIGQHLSRNWPFLCLVPSHFLNQWWLIVNVFLRSKFQWNFYKWNSNFYIALCSGLNVACKGSTQAGSDTHDSVPQQRSHFISG